ncbi:MAG: PadR family transcriptional regulator [Candidatus Omnitrophota bacterium]|nr:PadR family transcriptional regulator [Candidatus Omnitrophota bacterium]
MTQELVFLGLLKEGPKHAYQIKKLIRRVMGDFANIDTTSIYYPLTKLEEQGLIVKKKGKKGRRPEKYVYHLTKKGDRRFNNLLNKSFLVFRRPYFELDVQLYFLPFVKPDVAGRRLTNRLTGLKKVLRWLEMQKKTLKKQNSPPHLIAISEHNVELLRAELKFLLGLIESLKQK